MPAPRGRGSVRFDTITQDWFRDPVKAWCRFRLATGCAFTTISASALGMARFSAFLASSHPGAGDEFAITREVLEPTPATTCSISKALRHTNGDIPSALATSTPATIRT